MSKLVIPEMATEHIINRIAWAERQVIDPWEVHGNEEKWLGGFMDSQINEFNDKMERHIEKLKKELEKRKAK